MLDDTIAAISTSLSNSGISIIRISGKEAFHIIDGLFKSKSNISIKKQRSHIIHYGFIMENNIKVDEVLVSIMRAPNTFTREDIVEINCHGGIIVTQKILNIVLSKGARLAEPGEFTKRAFLNGRIDLSQSEAVIDIINSKTELALKSSVNQLDGALSKKIKPIRNNLIEIMAHIEASIDYPEYDIDELNEAILLERINKIIDNIKLLLDTVDNGRIIKEGLKVVIVGKPNVGKSSFLNALLNEQRAIVTDIPGTTRDTLEEYINLGGIPINIIDTAGIRETDDIIEKIGVKRSKDYMQKADLILTVLDNSSNLDKDDYIILDMIKNKKSVIVINKIDIENKLDVKELKKKYNFPIVYISSKELLGLEELENLIKNLFFKGTLQINDEVYITNVRHKNSLENALNSLYEVINAINMGISVDCLSVDLNNSYEKLGEITGESINEDIIDKIFSQFCLGK